MLRSSLWGSAFLAVLALACSTPSEESGRDPGGDGDGDSAGGDGDSAGGDGDGDSAGGDGDGDRSSGGQGGDGDGDTASGGDPNLGGLGDDQCRSATDCPTPDDQMTGGVSRAYCAPPFTPSHDQTICGAADWCGQCICPIRFSSGTACSDDQDCGGDRPFCGTNGYANSPLADPVCVGCLLDSDCGGETPVCAYQSGEGPICVACETTEDCPTGICTPSHECVTGCASDTDCIDPALTCSENLRCEARKCSEDADCPDNHSCEAGSCQRRSCTSDDDCEDVCVERRCHEDFGACYLITALP